MLDLLKNPLQNPNTKKLLTIAYIIILISGFFYVRSILKVDRVDVEDKKSTKAVEEIKPADVTLVVENEGSSKKYETRLRNVDSVSDLLEDLRENQDFTYEKTYYSYGNVLDIVNGVRPPEGYRWRLFESDVDITNAFEKNNLKDNNTYYLRIIKS